MALMPVYYTTTKFSRQKKKAKTASLLKAEAEHAKFLAKMRIGRRSISDGPAVKYVPPKSTLPETSGVIPVGVAAPAPTKVYSGARKLLGIATMHKSNMVPVFSQEDAESISRMRRG